MDGDDISINGFAVNHQVVGGIAGDPSTLKESGHQKMGVEWPQFPGNYISLHRVVTAQR